MSSAAPDRRTPGRAAALGTALAVVGVDLATKQWALSALGAGEVIGTAGRWLSLHLVLNPGAAFSLGAGSTWIFTAISVVITGVLVREVWKGIHSRVWQFTIGALMGGAVGNLLDRLFREPSVGQGHVVDFIDYAGFFVGNVADIAIVVGALVLALLSIREIPLRHAPDVTADPAPGQEGR